MLDKEKVECYQKTLCSLPDIKVGGTLQQLSAWQRLPWAKGLFVIMAWTHCLNPDASIALISKYLKFIIKLVALRDENLACIVPSFYTTKPVYKRKSLGWHKI
ncbi:MAG: hypothetical protein FJ119_07525 [Deltaproteobacteria bacterium]|nr:hypothetical protein [Deltaproteobacteria bacterium]